MAPCTTSTARGIQDHANVMSSARSLRFGCPSSGAELRRILCPFVHADIGPLASAARHRQTVRMTRSLGAPCDPPTHGICRKRVARNLRGARLAADSRLASDSASLGSGGVGVGCRTQHRLHAVGCRARSAPATSDSRRARAASPRIRRCRPAGCPLCAGSCCACRPRCQCRKIPRRPHQDRRTVHGSRRNARGWPLANTMPAMRCAVLGGCSVVSSERPPICRRSGLPSSPYSASR